MALRQLANRDQNRAGTVTKTVTAIQCELCCLNAYRTVSYSATDLPLSLPLRLPSRWAAMRPYSTNWYRKKGRSDEHECRGRIARRRLL
jgi:hypothetical protein